MQMPTFIMIGSTNDGGNLIRILLEETLHGPKIVERSHQGLFDGLASASPRWREPDWARQRSRIGLLWA